MQDPLVSHFTVIIFHDCLRLFDFSVIVRETRDNYYSDLGHEEQMEMKAFEERLTFQNRCPGRRAEETDAQTRTEGIRKEEGEERKEGEEI